MNCYLTKNQANKVISDTLKMIQVLNTVNDLKEIPYKVEETKNKSFKTLIITNNDILILRYTNSIKYDSLAFDLYGNRYELLIQWEDLNRNEMYVSVTNYRHEIEEDFTLINKKEFLDAFNKAIEGIYKTLSFYV